MARLDALTTAAWTAATALGAQRAHALADLDTRAQSLDSVIAAVDRQLSRFAAPTADRMEAQLRWLRRRERR